MALSITAMFSCDVCSATCSIPLEPNLRNNRGVYATAEVACYHVPAGWHVCEQGIICWRHLQPEASELAGGSAASGEKASEDD